MTGAIAQDAGPTILSYGILLDTKLHPLTYKSHDLRLEDRLLLLAGEEVAISGCFGTPPKK